MGVNPVIENADLERSCQSSFWPVKTLVHPGLLFCLNPTAKKQQKCFLPAAVRVYSWQMNTVQTQFSLTGVSLKRKYLPLYRPQLPDAPGVLHGRVFPRLRLPVAPLLASDIAKALFALTEYEQLNRKPSETSVKSED